MDIAFIPQPQKVEFAAGRLRIPAKGSIGICCHKLFPAAVALRDSLFPGCTISTSIPGVKDTVTLSLRAGLPAGGYNLCVAPSGVTVEADSPEAVPCALETLAQAAAQSPKGSLVCLSIADWPDFVDRGLYYDVCRGRVPKLQQLMRQVDLLARFKINHYQLYIEHTFAFRGHPDIGKDASPLSAEDILQLDAHCRRRNVEMVPSLASFGHLATVLKHPQYHELAEDWGVGKYVDGVESIHHHAKAWSLSPANPKIYDFLDSLFAEFLPLFSSDRFNVCCDETWDLGKGQSHELCQKIGKGRVYLGHIIKLNELCRKHGKKMMFWGDIIRQSPELIPEIPRDATVLDWGYAHNHPFDKIVDFKNAGLEFFACPGTNSWVSLFPRLPEATANIAGFAAAAKKCGARGLLNTDWGDGGHYNFMELSWHGYLFGAEQAWNTQADQSSFTRRFCKLLLGNASAAVVKAVSELGDATHLWLKGYYQSIWQHVFFAGPGNPIFGLQPREASVSTGGKIEHVTLAFNADVGKAYMKRLGKVRKTLAAAAKPAEADPHKILPYWLFAVDTLMHATRKLSVLGAGGSNTPAERKNLKVELASLKKRFERLWLATNRTSEIGITLERYQKAIDSL